MEWKYRKGSQNDVSDSEKPSVGLPHDSLMDHEENRKMFNYIAPYYDRTNAILSLGQDRYWRRKAINRLISSPSGLILDVGAGTGDIGLNIVSRYPQTTVVGIDTSLEMMGIGLGKAKYKGMQHNLGFCSSNVLGMCFADNTFDAAVTSFCIRNVNDRSSALSEIFRVIKSGARLVIVELTQPQGCVMKALFGIYSNTVMPFITRLFSSTSAYDYLTASMADFPKPDEFCALLKSIGFLDISFFQLTFGIVTVYEATKP